jgi:hypothetical protein
MEDFLRRAILSLARKDLFFSDLFRHRWRLDFLGRREIGERIETEELKKRLGGPIDDGTSRKVPSAHDLDQSLLQ